MRRSSTYCRGSSSSCWGVLLPLFLLLTSLVLPFASSDLFQRPSNRIYDLPLDANDTFHLYWQVNYEAEKVTFEVHSRSGESRPWFGIGFSDYGELPGSDMCVFWTDWRGGVHFQNALVDDWGRMRTPSGGGTARRGNGGAACGGFRHRWRGGVLKFTFVRPFDVCRPEHYVLDNGTTHVVWTGGAGPLYRLAGLDAKGDVNGMLRVQLLKAQKPIPDYKGKGVKLLEVLAREVEVPEDETTYWCSVQRLPEHFAAKHHVLQYAPAIQPTSEGVVHHMEVFHCEFPTDFEVPTYQGPCYAPDRPPEILQCKKVLAAWAMGALPMVYPEEAGLSMGGPDFNPYVMLEVHYNNPTHIKGIVDSSGLALHYTSQLRQHDAGIIELGLEYSNKMAIPPKTKSFTLTGYCIPQCTALSLPEDGIFIFASQLHTHLTGVRAWTKHYRDGIELPELNRDDHYSTHFQEIRSLPEPVHVLPGDALLMTCEFSTKDRENATVGGFAISDEMCVNYVHYYPTTQLEVCKSSIDTDALNRYFRFMNEWEGQPTQDDGDWRGNYNRIEWTPLRAALLHELFEEAPISMQCNRSSGHRFPGYWENMPLPPILTPLPTPKRPCGPGGLSAPSYGNEELEQQQEAEEEGDNITAEQLP